MSAAPHAAVSRNLHAVSRSLAGIAANVGREAAAAVDSARRSADQAAETASLAAEFEAVAELIEDSVRAQATLLDAARVAAGDNKAVLAALASAADGIGAISALIGGIAGRSRLLSLNARIEAARVGEAGRGFDVVAGEMNALSQQTWAATRDIEHRTQTLQDDVGDTRGLFDAAADRIDRQGAIARELVGAVDRQRRAAGAVASLAAETRAGIEDTAAAIGRVSSSAVAVDVIARQLIKAAEAIG